LVESRFGLASAIQQRRTVAATASDPFADGGKGCNAAEADFEANELSGRSAPRTGHSRFDLKNVETAKSKRDAARERPPALNRIDDA